MPNDPTRLLNKLLSEIAALRVEVRQGFKRADERTDDLATAVYGNGRPGLKDRVMKLEHWIKNIQKDEDDEDNHWTFMKQTSIGTLIAAIGALVGSIATALIFPGK